MRKVLSVSGIFLAAAIAHAMPQAYAQAPAPVVVPVALAPISRDSPVGLVALIYDAEIREIAGRTVISGTATFKLHNTDRLNDLQVAMGFPTWAGDPFIFDPARLDTFVPSVDNRRVTLVPSRADLRIGNSIRSVDWYTFTVALAGDEKRTVAYDLRQDLGDSAMPRVTVGLMPANNWKGNIGSARITLRFPETTTLEQIVAFDPPGPAFDGNSLSWLFQNHLASSNPYLTVLKPSVWNDLQARRRAARQNPNEANARTSLGNLYRSLAQFETPKSESFYAQAIAELESAIRLEPSHRAARQALGQLYETRAGPAAGPRRAAYVHLAIQHWEVLAPLDASARRQLAEDYFYLGLDAQTRSAFEDAQRYYERAAALAPNGAGPLFTLERASAQRRALNLAWARQALEQNNYPRMSERARLALGDDFVKSLRAPAFYVTPTRVTMASGERMMTFTLTPYAISRGELENLLSGLVAIARKNGFAGTVSRGQVSLTLDLTVPFDDPQELSSQLDALALVFGDAPEWALARAVTAPVFVNWSSSSQVVVEMMRYREGVDLAVACAAFDAELQALAPLESVTGSDEESQLRVAMVKHAQRGWQSARAQSGVIYQAGSEEFAVEPCAAREVALTPVTIQPLGIAALAILIQVLLGGILFTIWRAGKRRGT